MAGIIPPFATIHVRRHEAFQSLQSTLYVSGLMSWASYRLIGDLDKNDFMFSTLYFTLALVLGGDLHLQYACIIA